MSESPGINVEQIYSPTNYFSVVISFVFFMVYTITSLFDINIYIQEYGIGDTIISKSKLIYSYVAGYFTYAFKMFVSLFTLWMLFSIIRACIVIIYQLIIGKGDVSDVIKSGVRQSLISNFYLTFSFVYIDYFVLVLFPVAPALVLAILIGFVVSGVYSPTGIKYYEDKTNDYEKGSRSKIKTLKTMHNHLMYFFILVIMISMFAAFNLFFEIYDIRNPIPLSDDGDDEQKTKQKMVDTVTGFLPKVGFIMKKFGKLLVKPRPAESEAD